MATATAAATATPAAPGFGGLLRMSRDILSPVVWRSAGVAAVVGTGVRHGMGTTGAGAGTVGQGKRELTLPAVLDAVLSANPTLMARRARLDAAFQDVATFERRFYPSASFSAQTRSNDQGGAVAELSVRQPLYTFGALTADVEAAKKQTDVNRWELAAQERIALAETVDAAQQLEEGRALAAVVQGADAKYGAFASMMERRVQGGVSAPIEVELLRARQVQNDVDKNRFQSQAKDAAGKLAQLAGGSLEREALLGMSDAVSAEQGTEFLRQVDSGLSALVQALPTVLASQLTVEVETQRLQAQKAKLLPRLELGWTKQFALNGAPLSSAQRSGVLSVLFSADTTGGLSGWAGVQADATRLTAFMREADAKAREAEQDLRLAMSAVELEIQRESLLMRAVASNEEVLASYERQFAVGRKSWIEVLNAVRELQTTRLDLVRNRVAQKYGLIRLRIQLGLSPLGRGV